MKAVLGVFSAWLIAASPCAAQLTLLGAGPGGASAGGAPNTFDPAAGSNLTVVGPANTEVDYVATAGSVPGTKSFSSGVHIFHVTGNGVGNQNVGIVDVSWTVNSGLQGDPHACGYTGSDGHLDCNVTTVVTTTAVGSGAVWIKVDATANTIAVSTDGTTYSSTGSIPSGQTWRFAIVQFTPSQVTFGDFSGV